jgi:acetylornithine deacetylase/succinyl-diaminopimelate desuccinylase-like protein
MTFKGSRAGTIARAQHYYLEAIAPAFETMGFTCRTYDNPLQGQAPVLLGTRIEDPKLPTVLGYGHGDVICGQENEWTKGKGPWLLGRDGDRLYGRGLLITRVSTPSIWPR